MNYWLIKSEPETYGILHLKKDRQTVWDGVRNYQARNFLRQMQPGDKAFFYHSSTKIPGIVGLVSVVTSQVIDPTQFDPDSKYYDSKSTPKAPRWQTVVIEFVEAFPTLIPLERLKQEFSSDELWVTRQGNRLSVMPVDETIAKKILAMTKETENYQA
jgi:predicted RNA-binding protein with PUA-like domain